MEKKTSIPSFALLKMDPVLLLMYYLCNTILVVEQNKWVLLLVVVKCVHSSPD